MKLGDVLREMEKEPILLNDGADYWRPDNLRDELDNSWLEREVYVCETYIAELDNQGYQIMPPRYSVISLGETPYFVERKEDGSYRVKCMENPEQGNARFIYGQSRFEHKQAAYRRKSQLNQDWQKDRILGA